MSFNLILDEAASQYQSILAELGCQARFETHTSVNEQLSDCDVLLASAPLAEAFLKAGYRADWIQSTWAGNARLIPLLRGRNIRLSGVKGVFGPLIAEYVFANILPVVRNNQRSIAAQAQHRWDFFEPATLQGKVFVFIGTGSIGSHVSGVARVFGMKTLGVSLNGFANASFDRMFTREHINQAVSGADYIMLSVPETPDSFHLVDRTVLEFVKPGATLFSVGRGSTLNTSAVVDALSTGRLHAAVLDVFEEEPLPEDSPLWETPGVTITPHLAAVSHSEVIAGKFFDNFSRYEKGEALMDIIDLDRGY